MLARSSYEEALAIFRETDDLTGYALVLDGFASLEWTHGDHERAMQIAGAASAIQDVAGVGLAEVNRKFAQFYPEANLTDPTLAAAYQAGKQLTVDEAISLALQHDDGPPAG